MKRKKLTLEQQQEILGALNITYLSLSALSALGPTYTDLLQKSQDILLIQIQGIVTNLSDEVAVATLESSKLKFEETMSNV